MCFIQINFVIECWLCKSDFGTFWQRGITSIQTLSFDEFFERYFNFELYFFDFTLHSIFSKVNIYNQWCLKIPWGWNVAICCLSKRKIHHYIMHYFYWKNTIISLNYVDFWPIINLDMYSCLENLTTHITLGRTTPLQSWGDHFAFAVFSSFCLSIRG